MTNEQAADILNVSAEHLARLLDHGRIPCRNHEGHRYLRREDLLAFKRQRDRDRTSSLDRKVRHAMVEKRQRQSGVDHPTKASSSLSCPPPERG